MEGFILAAGLGTRLRPLTDNRPKALVEISGRTLLEITLLKLIGNNVRHIVVNAFHFADMINSFILSRHWNADVEVCDERPLLLDTGGALKHAAPRFNGNEPILIHNVDILSRINLLDLLQYHHTQGNLATLCCSNRPTQRLLDFDHDNRLIGRHNPAHSPSHTLAFSGISIVEPALFPLLPEADHPYPAIDQYIRLSPQHPIRSYLHPPQGWLDVGKPETLKKAQQWMLSSNK